VYLAVSTQPADVWETFRIFILKLARFSSCVYITLHSQPARLSDKARYFTFLYAQTRSRQQKRRAQHLKSGRGSARAHKKGKTHEKSSLRAKALMAKEAPTKISYKADERERDDFTPKNWRSGAVLMGHL
jgi:hypothetical protein